MKKWLPEGLFKALYRLASRVYGAWQKTADAAYYAGAYVYYTLILDRKNLRKIKTVRRILPYTMVGRTGLLTTYDAAAGSEKAGLPGCFVECGVARGGSSALMALVARDHRSGRKSWLFDSFEGLPEQTAEDEYQEPLVAMPQDKSASVVAPGYCLGTFGEVESLLFDTLGLDRDNLFMVKGWFDRTLPEHCNKVGDIAVLRIDADWYESTKCCLENLYDNVVSGGRVIIDDYGSVPGCKKATDEFLQKRGLKVSLQFDGRGGCSFAKP
ncbi:MAG TPA: TylF/MycF/NovP-related O-methyltransferase [Dehalococcoidales bacterium]|nr:MAG: hypothetical protein A2Z05_06655 [Chloroflexi bacterium RBG_16_60_22]HJX13178.1 TylF/MycF/NovP-related O-methyltransferase [Dehalococcoidales bacterium]